MTDLTVYEEPQVALKTVNLVPLAFIEGEPPEREIVMAPTPATKKRFQDLGGGRGYYYIEINFVLERLDIIFGPGRWVFRRTNVTDLGIDEKGRIEILFEGTLLAPGLPVEGIAGIGSDKYETKNPMATKANCIKTARADALKDAARMLGIGLDVRTDPKEGAIIEAKQNTLATIVRQLVDKGRATEVKTLFVRVAPQAFNPDTNEVEAFLIAEDQIDPLQKGLLALANDNARISVTDVK